ncbi:MAG: MGMT family protein [Candidatus Omnitrophota bacterium]
MTPFQRMVFKAVLKIPTGETRSYKWVAQQIGRPKAARAVAAVLHSNLLPLIVPCHRVIYSNGRLGGYRWGRQTKKKLIELEKSLKGLSG